MPNFWIIFTTGLVAGGVMCAALQGGLLAATIASQKREGADTGKVLPIVSFLIAKLGAYTILGAVLGWIGTAFTFSLAFQAILLTVVAFFMIGTALAMLDVHPIFRYFVIQPPKFLTRLVRAQTKQSNTFAPALLGAFTIFIPCGTTQAMMAIALSTRNPLYGAIVLFAFVLGTFPVFFAFGYAIEILKDVFRIQFARVAALVIIALAIMSLRSAVLLSGTSVFFTNMIRPLYCAVSFCGTSNSNSIREVSTNVTLHVLSNGYKASTHNIAKGQTITLTLVNDDSSSCTQSFTIPSLGLQTVVLKGQSKELTFRAPDQVGSLQYTCGMGMYGGSLNVL
jgi:uncharacterized protein